MMSTTYLDKFLNPVVQGLSPEAAHHLATVGINPAMQDRLDQLAEKSTEGELSDEERTEYETYIHAVDFLAVLQAQAKQRLSDKPRHY
jgi:hypothetical protein